MIPKKGLGNTSAAFAIITIALVASIGIFSLGSQTLSGGKRPTTGVISPLTGSDTSSVISSNGLRLTLSLLQTTFSEGRGIPINVSLFNTLSTQNNIAEASNRTQFGLGPCSQLPLGVGILHGY